MKESATYPMSVLRGLVTEGSNLLLMRLIALRKKMPDHMTFISFDQDLQIVQTTFVSNYIQFVGRISESVTCSRSER